MLAAPLIAVYDISTVNAITKNILINKEAIAKDQYVLRRQGYKILDEENFEIFMKPIANDDTAICLFNRSDDKMNVKVNLEDYTIANNFFITDMWLHKAAGTKAILFIAAIAKHVVVLLRLHKKLLILRTK